MNEIEINDLIAQFEEEAEMETVASVEGQDDRQDTEPGLIQKLMMYLNSTLFMSDCERTADGTDATPFQVAKSFCQRVLHRIASTLGIVIDVATNIITFTIRLLARILLSTAELIDRVGQSLITFVVSL